MNYTTLGRSAARVSRLCLGTMNFGPQTTEADSFAIMDRALELGINFFDTADVYGFAIGKGTTETIIGKWFAQGGERRDKVVLATKFYGDFGEWPNHGKVSAISIRRACENSLRRLQTDHIDLYQMHHIWRAASWDETWQAMEKLFQDGKIIYNGSSNFAGWHIVQANENAKQRKYLGLVSEQSLYNLNARTVELEVLPACEEYGVGVLPWSPLAGGLLAGNVKDAKEGRRTSERLKERAEDPKFELYNEFCKRLGESPANVALAWLLHQPGVTAPIIGPRTMKQLDDAIRATEIELTEDHLKTLDKLFPGPGGEAPEAYAW